MDVDADLARLRIACLRAACAETSCYPDLYRSLSRRRVLPSRLRWHCGAVALMLRGCFGGDIVTALVNGERHYWNRLPAGRAVDLTSCQYGGDGRTPLRRGRRVDVPDTPDPWALLFAARVGDCLAGCRPRRPSIAELWPA